MSQAIRQARPVVILKTSSYAFHHGTLGILRSLGALGVPVYIISESRFCPVASSRYLAGLFVWNLRDMSALEILDGLAAIGERLGQPTVLVPTDDLGAILTAEHAPFLCRWFIFPRLPAGLPRCVANKLQLHVLCTKLGVPTPRVLFPQPGAQMREMLKEVTLPVVVKAPAAWLKSATKTLVVESREKLADILACADAHQERNLLIQEYISKGEDWFFHGYCDGSHCHAGFTARKLRSFPIDAGFTTFGEAQRNDGLRRQAESFIKTIGYAGIMDIDYRLDPRDGQYKLLDFNPRIGANFRLFESDDHIDVARTMYFDLIGRPVGNVVQTEPRLFVVEAYDSLSCLQLWWRKKLSLRDVLQSPKGKKEFAWFRINDPVPFLLMWISMAWKLATRSIRGGARRADKSTP
jgi:predicted ATP-grasp superfamily ATP-dependent carboligase